MHKKYFPLLMLALVPLMQGCPKDTHKITDTYEVNEWIYNQMSRHYLWSAKLPVKNESGQEAATQDYFDKNLRYRDNTAVALEKDYKGDRFSSIKYTGKADAVTRGRAATEKDYDFGFLLSRIINGENGSLLHMQVLYVVPGGPAEKAGMRRGDAFDEINYTPLTNENYQSLLSNGTITVHVLNREIENTTDNTLTIDMKSFYNQPILLDTIYEEPAHTAYLIYNHFSNGDSSGEASYSKKLKEAFARYKAAGVKNLILDLRYNGGGEVENARLLASLIAPADMLGQPFMYIESNLSFDSPDEFEAYKLLSDVGGYNADIQNLYIITSSSTASASELIIHTLRPIFRDAGRKLFVVGATTRGKNVGSVTTTNSKYEWEISLITMRVNNLDKVSGYEKGLSPDAPALSLVASEYVPHSGYYLLPPLGDYESEALLNFTMSKYFEIPEAYQYSNMWSPRRSSRSPGEPTPIPMVPERGLTAEPVVAD